MNSFSRPAQEFWNKIPAEIRIKILNEVWCGKCKAAVSILNITGSVEGGDLVLKGNCHQCGRPVARLIEGD